MKASAAATLQGRFRERCSGRAACSFQGKLSSPLWLRACSFQSSPKGSAGDPAKQPAGLPWAHLDLNQGPLPYQGSALTGLSYGPVVVRRRTRENSRRPQDALSGFLPSVCEVPCYLAWGCSSVGRAPGLQPGGQGFKSPQLHNQAGRS